MTIGSPIEEHLILWPELFQPFECGPNPKTGVIEPAYKWHPESPEGRIKWRNYSDYGDPIAYRLAGTSEWMERNRWERGVRIRSCQARVRLLALPLPGQGHNDYWDDPEVFGHFIEDVVRPKDAVGRFP